MTEEFKPPGSSEPHHLSSQKSCQNLSAVICLTPGSTYERHLCLCTIIMAPCQLVHSISASLSEAGVARSSHHSLLGRDVSSVKQCHRKDPPQPPPLTCHLLCPLFYLARALKNNHPGHAPLLPIISLIYPHLSLGFPFPSVVLLSRLLLIVIVLLCPRHCPALSLRSASSLFFPALRASLHTSHYCSSPSSTLFPLFTHAFDSTWQKAVLSSLGPIFIIPLLHFIH